MGISFSYVIQQLNPSTIFSKLAYINPRFKTSNMPRSGHSLAEKYPTALITGASSGIGAALANLLVEAGVQVFGTSRFPNRPGLEKSVHWLEFNGESKKGLNEFIVTNSEMLSNISFLVNNSGSSCFGKASEIPDDILSGQKHLLLKSPIALTEHVLPPMKERGKGAIVNVSSLAALFTLPYMEGYSLAKAALGAFTQKVITENSNSGIVIIDFQPGDYRTKFNHNIKSYGNRDELQNRVWDQLEKHLINAPLPEKAAEDILCALNHGISGTVRSGSFFQSKIAPAGHRILPKSLLDWAIRKYYHLP
jgi:short-subunit dehydrogenase